MNNGEHTQIEILRSTPAARRIEAIELDSGQWMIACSDDPAIVGVGDFFEDAALDLFDQLDQVKRRGPREH